MVSILNSLGVGSGVDTTALIDALVNAENAPRAAALTSRATKVEATVSALSQVRAGLDGMVSGLASRTAGGVLGAQPASSNTAVVAAAATSGATPTLLPTTIEVRRLATGQTLVAAALATADAPVGLGTFTLTTGTITAGDGSFGFAAGTTAPVTVTIDATNNTLFGLRDAINATHTGVAATIINDGAGARLILKGATGSASAFTVDTSPLADHMGLARFVYAPASTTMTSAATAQDASLILDGIVVTRASNTVTDLIPGVTLALRSVGSGAPVTIAPSRDIAGIKTAVSDLAATLSALNGLIASLTKPADAQSVAGALIGDSAIGRLRQQLGTLTSTPVLAGVATGVPNRLADVGLVTARDGTLTVDDARLAAAVGANPDAVNALLSGLTAANGPLARIRTGFDAVVGSSGTTDALTQQRTAIATNRATLTARTADYRAGLVAQYAAMEAAVAASKATQSFLDEQVKAWNRTTP